MGEKINNIHFIAVFGPLAGYIIFEDFWICGLFTHLENIRTGKKHEILDIKYRTTKKYDVHAGMYIEEKKSAVKISDQSEIKASDTFKTLRIK